MLQTIVLSSTSHSKASKYSMNHITNNDLKHNSAFHSLNNKLYQVL